MIEKSTDVVSNSAERDRDVDREDKEFEVACVATRESVEIELSPVESVEEKSDDIYSAS